MNLRRLAHVMHETGISLEEQAVVFVDIAKAFDTVEWPYLMQVLAVMGLGPKFLSWVKLLYTQLTGQKRMGQTLSDS